VSSGTPEELIVSSPLVSSGTPEELIVSSPLVTTVVLLF
jgi:hypothetical protein